MHDTIYFGCQVSLSPMSRIVNGVRELREEREWSQGRLAAEIGVSRQTVNSIERNRYEPSLGLALTIAALFECPVDEIFWLAKDKENIREPE